jgi:hypothetical protein
MSAVPQLRGVAPTRRATAFHAASWPWPGPAIAWATSCNTVSRISAGPFRSTKNRESVIVRVRNRQDPSRRRALSKPKDQSARPKAAMTRRA